MSGRALKIAVELMHVPSQVRFFRTEPLPDGVPMVLRIAADDDEAVCAAAASTDMPREFVQQAAVFFIEQILFAPDADSYRVLGASQTATAAELRHNVALLLKWLHPDRDSVGTQSTFIRKVTEAWNNVKTPERRAIYEDLRRSSNQKNKPRHHISKHKSQRRKPTDLSGRFRATRYSPSLYRLERAGLFRRIWSLVFHRPV